MAGLLPLVRTGTSIAGITCLYPVTRTVSFLSDVAIAMNSTEQRSRLRPPLTTIELPYVAINATDMASMRAFFASQKGQFDSTWGVVIGKASLGTISGGGASLTIVDPYFTADSVGQQVVIAGAGIGGGAALYSGVITAYVNPLAVTVSPVAGFGVSGADTRWGAYLPNMTLTDPNFMATEESQTRTTYSFVIHARQTANPQANTGTSGTSFPALGNGSPAQFPFVKIDKYLVTLNDNPIGGTRYAWTWIGAGLTGFPTSALKGYELHGLALQDSDLAIWEAHFRANWGRWSGGNTAGGFSFTDPDSMATITGMRYDLDDFVVTHNSYQNSSVVLKIQQTH